MKQLRYIVTILLVLCIALACKKEPETHYDLVKHKNSGTVTALLNGKAWQSDLTMTALNSGSEQRIYIHADVYVNGTVRQALSIGGIYLNNDKQVVYNAMNWIVFEQVGSPKKGKDTCVSSFQLVDGDVVENGYSILEDEENFIQLEGYDKTSPKARGRFQLTLYRFQPNTYPQTQGLPDTLRFTNGKIDVQIMKYD